MAPTLAQAWSGAALSSPLSLFFEVLCSTSAARYRLTVSRLPSVETDPVDKPDRSRPRLAFSVPAPLLWPFLPDAFLMPKLL